MFYDFYTIGDKYKSNSKTYKLTKTGWEEDKMNIYYDKLEKVKDCPNYKDEDNIQINKNSEIKYNNYGWICPVCGRGNASFMTTCSCQGWDQNKVTCKY